MGRLVAKKGAVNGASTVRHIVVNDRTEEVPYVASDTDGATGRIDGNTDWDGYYTAYGHTPATMPGESLALQVAIDATHGCSGTAIADAFQMTCDIERGRPVEHTVRFSGNGTLTHGAQTVSDANIPNPPSSKFTKVSLGTVVASPVWTDVPDVRHIQFSIACQNPPAVTSSTAGVTKRAAGNVDARLIYKQHTADLAALPTRNQTKAVKVWGNVTDWWELKWMKCVNVQEIEVPIEQGGYVGAACEWGLEAYTPIGGTPTKGHIKKPGGTTWWPV